MFIDGVDVIELLDSSSAASESPQGRRIMTRSMKSAAAAAQPAESPFIEPKRTKIDSVRDNKTPQKAGVPTPLRPALVPSQPPVKAPPEPPHNALIFEWKSLEEQLRCDICKQLLDVPVSLKCFHTFCSFCIRRYLELSGNDYCPCCRVPATSTDIRLEPRLAGILGVLGKDRGSVRKKFRSAIRRNLDQDTRLIRSANETFNKQADLMDVFRVSGTNNEPPIGRTLLPVYKSLKDKQLRELVEKDGLIVSADLVNNRDELVRVHKEFLFTVQAAFDGIRMGMYSEFPPTKSGLAKIFNSELRWRNRSTSRFMRGKSEAEIRREKADKSESVSALADAAQQQMRDQLRQALLRRKQKTYDVVAHDSNS